MAPMGIARFGAMGRKDASADGAKRARQRAQNVIYSHGCHANVTKGMTPMDKAQADALSSKHAALHALIDEEEHRSHPDEDLLHRLKKEKLRLKDALAGHYAH